MKTGGATRAEAVSFPRSDSICGIIKPEITKPPAWNFVQNFTLNQFLLNKSKLLS
jgi:hypothetical protein